ncbi:nucleotide exchange factor SIL1-like, partial [Paramacrobiotus metropolitanus]|uniref:nucleotide exchange factor SIL1-like n=1 Tax=Paramacrobiotus metropolitanus TaxID=2943436 RepID=UPI002445B800
VTFWLFNVSLCGSSPEVRDKFKCKLYHHAADITNLSRDPVRDILYYPQRTHLQRNNRTGQESHSPPPGAITSPSSSEPFIATREWQPIRESQSIPAGLHVRLDLASGQRHAKLMDPAEPAAHEVAAFSAEERLYLGAQKDDTSSRTLLRDELQRTLEGINKQLDAEDTQGKEGEDAERVKKQFRSMEELKKEFAEMNLAIKTDREILKELVQQLTVMQRDREAAEKDKLINVLQDVEYLVHQVDNARDFVDMKGLRILKPFLLMTEHEPLIRAESAHILGSAAQSNAKVQIAVLEEGLLEILLKGIHSLSHAEKLSAPGEQTLARFLYAVSALVRHFPLAQKRFVAANGVAELVHVMRNSRETPKLQRKVMAFFNDLLMERMNAGLPDATKQSDDLQRERARQYGEIPLESRLASSGWCESLVDVFASADRQFDASEAHNALHLHGTTCQPIFKANWEKIQFLCVFFRQKASSDAEIESDEYYTAFAKSCDDFVKVYKISDVPDDVRKDEL